MKNIKYTAILSTLSLVCLLSCSKDQLVERPPHFVTADVLYTTAAGFESGVNGLYSLMRQEREGLSYTTGFGKIGLAATIFLSGTDNIAAGASGDLTTITGDWTKSTSSDPNLDKVFLWLYKTVSAANAIITRAENPEVNWGAPGTKERILAEAHTTRAWAYRQLTYLWGDVPLLTAEVTGENIRTDLTREKVATIRRVMIEDLKYASENLPWLPLKPGRLTRGVAQTYLSEIYLAIGKPDSALIWADKCINEGPYKLITSRYGAGIDKPGVAFMDMFNPSKTNISDGNTEALWVMQWERVAIGGGDNLMRHESTMRYILAQYGGKLTGGTIVATDERGGRGWSRQTITKNALLLYNSSSDAVGVPNRKVDQRGSEFALRKYFIMTAADKFANLPAGTLNTGTGKPWQVGDTIWVATPFKTSVMADAGKKSVSGAVNFALLSATNKNNNDWPTSMKFAYCDPGFPLATESHQDQIYMRLAETILLRAEAKIRLGQSASSDINLLRNRANATPVTDASMGADLTAKLNFILDERSRELVLEEQRRYTLARMGGKDFFYPRINTWNPGSGFTLRDTLYAIPQSVIDANLTLKMPQNGGFAGN